MRKVRHKVCGSQDVDIVWKELVTYQAYYDEDYDRPVTGHFVLPDCDPDKPEGLFCNECGDYVSDNECEPGDQFCIVEDGESFIELGSGGYLLAFPMYEPFGVDYVCIRDPHGKEVVRWVMDEFREDPESVVGALLGAMKNPRHAEEIING